MLASDMSGHRRQAFESVALVLETALGGDRHLMLALTPFAQQDRARREIELASLGAQLDLGMLRANGFQSQLRLGREAAEGFLLQLVGEARLDVAVGGRAIDDLRRLLTSPYLLTIAALIVLGQVLGGFMYQEQAKYVEQAYATLGERAALFARIDLAVNLLALVFQGAIVGWLAARGGLRLALGFVPLLLIGSLVVLALLPVGAVLLATQVFRRAVDYGLFKPTREMLFTVLNPESKFKSKSLIDTLLQRGGDSAAQLTYPLVSGLGLAGVAWACAGVSVLMLAGAFWLGGAFGRQETRAPG